MAKTLDFNTIERPTLRLIMQDDDKTRIDVSTPNEKLVEELQQIAPHLTRIMETPTEMQNKDAYELAARLINCNRSGIVVTAEDLRDKYHMNLESLLIFFGAYVEFIDEISNAKN